MVALGVQVDNPSVSKAKAVLKDIEGEVQKRTSSMAANYAKATTVIVSSLISIGAATVDLMNKVAQADLGYEKFALRMYMAKDAAKQFKIVTDAMGESIEDIAWIPELNQRYQTLMKEAKGMELPGGASNQLQYIRDIRFEFTRLKVEATYGLQWVGYYLFKYLMEPITGTKFGLKEINDWIQRKMPEWADKIARFLVMVWNLASAAFRALKDLGEALKTIWDSMPSWLKSLIAVGAAIAIAITAPVTTALASITALVLMIEDFYAYIDGRKSNPQLAPIWDKLIDYAYKLNRYWAGTVIFIEEFNRSVSKFGWSGIFGDKNRKAIEQKEFGGDMIERSRKRMEEWERANPRWDKENVPIRQGAPVRNDILREAQRVSDMTGVPVQNIYGHWYHETGGFKNRGSRELNNLAGINVPGGRGQDYKKYSNLDEFGNDYAWLLKNRYKEALRARSTDEYMAALKKKGYFTGPLQDAQRGAAYGAKQLPKTQGRYLGEYQGEFVPMQPTQQPTSQVTNNIPITIQSNSPEETARHVENIIKKYQGQQNVMDIRFPAVSGVAP